MRIIRAIVGSSMNFIITVIVTVDSSFVKRCYEKED